MKLIFLDIDGVLNSTSFLQREDLFAAPMTKREAKYRFCHPNSNLDVNDLRMIDHTKVALLNQIIEQTGAQVVISSSWRLGRNLDDLRDVLAYHGFMGAIIGTTPDLSMFNSCRGDEIWEWLCDHDPEDDCAFVILDDNNDMDHLHGNLVQTSMKNGLTQREVDIAIKVLNSETT